MEQFSEFFKAINLISLLTGVILGILFFRLGKLIRANAMILSDHDKAIENINHRLKSFKMSGDKDILA